MDNLTHGLLGLAIGSLRRPDGTPGRAMGAPNRLSPTDRAVLLGCVLAAELPDVDSIILFTDPVHHALVAHRGWTHSLVAAPALALVAAVVVRLFFRDARLKPVFAWSLASLLFAHLFSDLWTGWGTKLLLPFSDARLLLDWTMVIDPWITLPLLAGAIVALVLARRGRSWRPALHAALAFAVLYLGVRVVLHHSLSERVREAYPAAEVTVFPKLFSVFEWRWVAVTADEQVAGVIRTGASPIEQSRHRRPRADAIPDRLSDIPQVRDALAWARFPIVETHRRDDGGSTVRISDLRYHLNGEPTLGFVIEIGADDVVEDARQVRGGSPRELLERMRESDR